MLLTHQTALITGAGRGIGRAVALRLAQEGAKVAVAGRTKKRRDEVTAEITALGLQAKAFPIDVTNENQVNSAVENIRSIWGSIDILVNNAGIIQYDRPVWDVTVREWDDTMAVNSRGTFLCCRAIIPHMIQNKSGVIINICSSSARSADEDYGPYVASKWAQAGYTTSLARSVRPYGIKVNGINPGWVDTDMARRAQPDGDPYWSTPEEIAEATLFLATKAPRDMTGQFIDIYGS